MQACVGAAGVIRNLSNLLGYWGLAAVVGLSFGLRFWQLGRFHALVFDEVYFALFAQSYLMGDAVFDAHPPLGKYLIAVGIWLGERLSWLSLGADAVVAEVGLRPVSYRWMNAFVGALIPLVVVGIGRELLRGGPFEGDRIWLFALLAGGFVAIDGLFVTEARYALLNTYVVFFGLLGHWLWLYARSGLRAEQGRLRMLFRTMAGVALGAAIATKWNGLGYVLSLLLWESWRAAPLISVESVSVRREENETRREKNEHKREENETGKEESKNDENVDREKGWLPVEQFFQQILWDGVASTVGFLIVLPALTYCLIWVPHLHLTQDSFFAIHRTLFLFHQGLDEVQIACSKWFTWPLLIKPIAYWYEADAGRVYTVNNLGNPALWWLSSAAMVALSVQFVRRATKTQGVVAYVVMGYLANWLPWAMVGRCTYNYLYMPAAIFGFMGFAWLLSDWLSWRASRGTRRMGFVLLGMIALAFFFWLPLSLGSPLTPEQLRLRWWLPSWV